MTNKFSKSIFLHTPLVESTPLSKRCNSRVYLKLENVQPTGSFKLRGLSYHCQQAAKRGLTHFVCSSGGNAGLAVAYTGRFLQLPVTIVVPSTTPAHMIERIKDEGAEVLIYGSVWDEANEKAKELIEGGSIQGGVLIHPFNHPECWEGHASMITECASEMTEKPDVVVVAVGGGGLLCGVLQGLQKVSWGDVPVLAMETLGADSFASSVLAGHLVTLPGITSVAKCLGATRVAEEAFEWTKRHRIISRVVNDVEAVKACASFLDDHRMLVEPACGAALAALYSDLLQQLKGEGELERVDNVLVIVCGGSMCSMQDLKKWMQEFNLDF